MYLLEDGTSLTSEIKEAFKRGLTRAYIKLGDTIIDPDNYLQNAKYKDEKADPETGQFIGVTSMRELTIKLYNYENSFNLENQEVEYYVGALVGNEYKYINFGNFIVQKPENQEVNEETTFTALDYMSKFDGDDEYVPEIAFPTTLLGLTQDICRQAGVELGNTDFRNANMQILSNPFVNGENCRTVLKSIAKLAFSPAYIGQDNKLYIKFDVIDGITEEITIDDFFENKPNDEVKPLTAITLRSSEVKASGQTIYASQEMIEEYGINELIIEEDYLAYTDTLRNAYLTGATALFGLTYKPLTIDLLGSIYLSFNDVISITNLQENTHITYALNNSHEYNGTLYNTISVPSLSETEEKYKYEKEDETYRRKTAIEIDKANQQITAVVGQIGEQNTKILQITATVDELNSKISTIADITTSQETQTAHLSFEDINASEPITVKIHPIIQNISYLYPSVSLFPSSTTYLKRRTLRFYNTETDEIFDYELPCDLYYYDADHYDDFLLDYGDGGTGTCIVNKKVGINADGTTYLLNEQRTIEYEYPSINLTNGDYQVSLVDYEAGYLFVRLMVQNIYTTQFATRVEMNSAITQKADEINLGVDYKLTAYATTTEMNSAINLSANSITNSVRATYATKETTNTIEAKLELKVNTDDLISEINASADRITLTSGRLIITSGNFQLDSAGNITCTGGKIGGWAIGTNAIYKNYTSGGSTYQSGIYTSDSSTAFLYAGAPLGGYLSESNLQLLRDGKIIIRGYGTATDLLRVEATNSNAFTYIQPQGMGIVGSSTYRIDLIAGSGDSVIYVDGSGSSTTIRYNGIVTPSVTQTSREQNKKNFEKLQNGLDIVNSIDIYKYNLITEKDNFKKHIGFVIGKEFNYSSEITTIDQNDEEIGVDTYSMVSVGYKAIQELHQEIQELKERIK